MAQTTTTEDDVLRGARQLLYHFFSLALSDPRTARWSRIGDANLQRAVAMAAEYLAEKARARADTLAPGELGPEALDPSEMLRFLEGESVASMAELHDRAFSLMLSKECPQYETEYSPQTFSVYRSHQLADIAGFYRAFGLEPSRECPERADHVALELEFMAWLFTKEQYALDSDTDAREENAQVCRDAQERFFADHLVWWIPAFARALRNKADDRGFYGAVARALAGFMTAERGERGLAPPTELLPPTPTDEEAPACGGCSGQA